MRRKLNAEQYEKLSDELKKLYEEKDGVYLLILEDDEEDPKEDVGALKRAKDREKERRQKAEAKLKEYEEREEEEKEAGLKKAGDYEALEKSYKAKLAKKEADHAKEVDSYKNHIQKILVDDAATKMASKISTVPKLLKSVIAQRLLVEFGEDEPKARVLDASGKPSAMTFEELEAEFLQNEEYKPILIASRASGGQGGSKDPAQGGGAPTSSNGNGQTFLSKLPNDELIKNITAKVDLTQ